MVTTTTVTDETYRELPSAETLREAGHLRVKNEGGIEVDFNTLYTVSNAQKRQFIIFIRHFFCGACEEYIKAISRTLTPEKIAAASTSISIIGCGGSDLIADYRKRNDISFPVYADLSLELFDKLGMPKSSAPISEGWNAKQPDYHSRSFFDIVWRSTYNALSSGPKAIRGGPPGQNGGALLFESGELKICHRMRTTSDYLQIGELQELLDIVA